MTGDRAVRWATVAAVIAVAGVAAYVSYWHAVTVVTALGEHDTIGHLYPVTIDGIIVAASMVLLDSARHSEAPPWLAWPLLAGGVLVTLAANVTYGARSGLSSALWAVVPALAFVGCYELLMLLVRASARRAGVAAPCAGPSSATPALGTFSAPLFTDAETAAAYALRRSIEGGNPLSNNQLATSFHLTKTGVAKARQLALAGSNGHALREEVSGDEQ